MSKKKAVETRGQGKARRVAHLVVNEMGLTDKEQKFVDHFVDSGGKNHAESARQAGYSEKSIHIIANQLLKKQHILDAIAKARRDSYQATAVRAKAFLEEQVNDASLPANIRQAAARDLMDRGGDKPKDKLEIEEKTSPEDQAKKLKALQAKYLHNNPTAKTQAIESNSMPPDSQSDGEGNLTKH